MSRINRTINTTMAAMSVLLATGGMAMAGSLGGPLELADEGSFFVNGETTSSSHPGASLAGPPRRGGAGPSEAWPEIREVDVRAVPHPDDRERSGERHGAGLRPHPRHLVEHAGRPRGLVDLLRAQGLPGLRRRSRRPRPLRFRP